MDDGIKVHCDGSCSACSVTSFNSHLFSWSSSRCNRAKTVPFNLHCSIIESFVKNGRLSTCIYKTYKGTHWYILVIFCPSAVRGSWSFSSLFFYVKSFLNFGILTKSWIKDLCVTMPTLFNSLCKLLFTCSNVVRLVFTSETRICQCFPKWSPYRQPVLEFENNLRGLGTE
jgi:hypothetical protein